MNFARKSLLLGLFICVSAFCLAQGHIRINYVGYLPQSKKVAVYILEDEASRPAPGVNEVNPSGQVPFPLPLSSSK